MTSLEINEKHRAVAVENVKHAGYGSSVEILLGKAGELLEGLKKEGRVFDMVFIDADWESQGEYFEKGVELCRKGGVVYVDNVVRMLFEEMEEGKDIERESMLRVVRKLGDKVKATMVTTAGSHKGKEEEAVDGFVIAVKL